MITKGQDHCLYVFTRDAFAELAQKVASAPLTSESGRLFQRNLFSGTDEQNPDGQGRIAITPELRRYAGLQQGVRGDRRVQPGRDLGRRRPGSATRTNTRTPTRRRRRRCFPDCSSGAGTRAGDGPAAPPPGCRAAPGATALAHLPRCQVRRIGPTARHPGGGTAGGRGSAVPGSGELDDARQGRWVVGHPDDGSGRLGPGTFPWPCPASSSCCGPALADRPAVLVDATLGLGGHAAALLAEHPQLTLVGLDRDPEALALAGRRLARARRPHRTWCTPCTTASPRSLAELGLRPGRRRAVRPRGLVAAAGRGRARGFSYSRDADLDMRMDPTTGPTAAEVLNTYPVPQLARVLREYGEERFAGRIASAIGRRRGRRRCGAAPSSSSCSTTPCPRRPGAPGGTRPSGRSRRCASRSTASSTRCRAAIPAALDSLAVGGRIVVLAYHSLEDRIVKRALAERSASRTPVDLPVELPGHGPELRLLVRGSEQAGEDEIADNPRAASVRLRAAERIREVAA